MRIVILPESSQFPLQIIGIPEEHMVEEFAANGSAQSFDEGMRLQRDWAHVAGND